MALWLFRTPTRIEERLDENHPLWSRVTTTPGGVGVCLVQHADGSWAEYEALPQTIDAGADYAFGRTDRSSVPAGRGFGVSQDGRGGNLEAPEDREFQSPLRIYRGGHTYVIDAPLKAELEAAATAEEPDGYDAYISADVDLDDPYEDVYDDTYGGRHYSVGDEILASGRTAEYEQDTN